MQVLHVKGPQICHKPESSEGAGSHPGSLALMQTGLSLRAQPATLDMLRSFLGTVGFALSKTATNTTLVAMTTGVSSILPILVVGTPSRRGTWFSYAILPNLQTKTNEVP